MNRKFGLFAILLLVMGLVLAACGSGDKNNNGNADNNGADADADGFTAALVTDVGGIDDKSFNQSSWEGLQAWGEEHGLAEKEGYDYAQSDDEPDYLPNLTRLVRNDYDLIFGIGFMLEDAIDEISGQYPDNMFAIVDSVVDQPNVASITFADNESSFLVGVAAAQKTKKNKLGFVGGAESSIITAFEVGFIAGVKSVNPDIEVKVQYAGAFDAADDGKLIASSMYNDGIDVIFHASGATGNGVFAQAKDIKRNEPDREVWVIGVDMDQHEEGQIDEYNITLTSALKQVGNAVQDVANMAMEDKFPGGDIVEFNLADDGVGYAKTNEDALTSDIVDEMEDWKEKIINGDLDVPSTDEELVDFLDAL